MQDQFHTDYLRAFESMERARLIERRMRLALIAFVIGGLCAWRFL